MSNLNTYERDGAVSVLNPNSHSPLVFVCEHASSFIPTEFNGLGLDQEALLSHAAWDPGAMPIADHLARHFEASLVSSNVSRLVYDCNRPPSSPDAMRPVSELINIPGNEDLTTVQKQARTNSFYEPFRESLADTIASRQSAVVITIHTFSPLYYGKQRDVEIGILHDSDTRLADALLDITRDHTNANVQRNQPYGPEDDVTHTLQEHALPGGHLNLMLEIRNDLVKTHEQQEAMSRMFTGWLEQALNNLMVNT